MKRAHGDEVDCIQSTPATNRPVPLSMELTDEDFQLAGKDEEKHDEKEGAKEEEKEEEKETENHEEESQEKQKEKQEGKKEAGSKVEVGSGSASRVPPTIFQTITANDGLVRAMRLMDLEVACDALSMSVIQSDAFHEYDNTRSAYRWLYGLMQDGGIVGQRRGTFYSWQAAISTSDLDNPVVYLGSKGEKAKVGRTAKEFLQVALSLYPYFMNAIGFLPAVNLKENVKKASEADFCLAKRITTLTGYLEQDRSRDPRGLRETTWTSNKALQELGLARLSTHDALETLVQAHLAHPRFAIKLKPMHKPKKTRERTANRA